MAVVLPLWLVLPVSILLTLAILALPIVAAFLPDDEENKLAEGRSE